MVVGYRSYMGTNSNSIGINSHRGIHDKSMKNCKSIDYIISFLKEEGYTKRERIWTELCPEYTKDIIVNGISIPVDIFILQCNDVHRIIIATDFPFKDTIICASSGHFIVTDEPGNLMENYNKAYNIFCDKVEQFMDEACESEDAPDGSPDGLNVFD